MAHMKFLKTYFKFHPIRKQTSTISHGQFWLENHKPSVKTNQDKILSSLVPYDEDSGFWEDDSVMINQATISNGPLWNFWFKHIFFHLWYDKLIVLKLILAIHWKMT